MPLGIEDIPQPEEQAASGRDDRRRPEGGILRSGRQRAAHLQRVTEDQQRMELDAGGLEHAPPEGKQPADPGILADEQLAVGVGVVQQPAGLFPVGAPGRIGEPLRGDRRLVVPAGARRVEQPVVEAGDAGRLPVAPRIVRHGRHRFPGESPAEQAERPREGRGAAAVHAEDEQAASGHRLFSTCRRPGGISRATAHPATAVGDRVRPGMITGLPSSRIDRRAS